MDLSYDVAEWRAGFTSFSLIGGIDDFFSFD
jgi:hypothetical protein